MFLELSTETAAQGLQYEFEGEKNINSIRHRYGLKILSESEKAEDALENLFEEAQIPVGALDIKIENDNELQIIHEDKEFIEAMREEEYIEDSKLDEENMLYYEEDEDDDYHSEESYGDEEEDEYITEEMNQRARKIKKERKKNSDEIIFE